MEERRVPPHSLEAETAVLGAMLLDEKAIPLTMEIFRWDREGKFFYSPQNQKIYRTIAELVEKKVPADLVTVTDELRKNKMLEEIGGPEYLSQLVSEVITTANVQHHARIIKDKAMARQGIRASMEAMRSLFENVEPTDEIIEKAATAFYLLARRETKAKSPKDIVREIFERLEKTSQGTAEKEKFFLKTGYHAIDSHIYMEKGHLVTVGGRPKMGKTTFMINILENMVDQKAVPFVVSLEMTQREWTTKRLSLKADIEYNKIVRGKDLSNQEWGNLAKAADEITNIPYYVDDEGSLNPVQIFGKIRRAKENYDISVAAIDYIQMTDTSSETTAERAKDLGTFAYGLKALAKELDIVCMFVAQLGRKIELRADKRPMLSDFKESGGLEDAIDDALLLYREDYYNPNSERKGILDVTICGRYTIPRIIQLGAYLERSKICDLTKRDYLEE